MTVVAVTVTVVTVLAENYPVKIVVGVEIATNVQFAVDSYVAKLSVAIHVVPKITAALEIVMAVMTAVNVMDVNVNA